MKLIYEGGKLIYEGVGITLSLLTHKKIKAHGANKICLLFCNSLVPKVKKGRGFSKASLFPQSSRALKSDPFSTVFSVSLITTWQKSCIEQAPKLPGHVLVG